MNFDVQTLRWYIAVAEELHFARAAKKLNIARPKLSKAVIDLEGDLGYSLFVPGASPTELTDRGAQFLGTARAAVAEDDERARVEAEAAQELSETLTVGYTEGVTPTKWVRIWAERSPDVRLELVATTLDSQVAALRAGSIDVGFVRLPIDREELSVIGLYEEVPVVVVGKDHPVSAFDRVSVADLADEHLLQDPSAVPEWSAVATELADGSRVDAPPATTNADLIEYVAAGLGIAVLPQSIARLHSRKDLVYRPVDGVAGSSVAIAWMAEKTSEHVEEFVGIVRGRSVRSSRGTPTPPSAPSPRAKAAAKSAAKNKAQTGKSAQSSKAGRGSRKPPSSGKRPKRP